MHKPNLGVDPRLAQQHGQGLIRRLMASDRDQNAGRVDRKMAAMAELLKRGGATPGEPQDNGRKEGLNQMQRRFLAERLLAG